jgi:hypothetical protein
MKEIELLKELPYVKPWIYEIQEEWETQSTLYSKEHWFQFTMFNGRLRHPLWFRNITK